MLVLSNGPYPNVKQKSLTMLSRSFTGLVAVAAAITITTASPILQLKAQTTELQNVSGLVARANHESTASCSYWMEELPHRGVAPFQNDPNYKVFRNVKDYGAKGDGVTDDTAAINLAISDGNRCAPGTCVSATTTPAVVYFPSGVYRISTPIIDYYHTTLIGNPNCLPTIKTTSSFSGIAAIDGDPYGPFGLAYGATNVFWREIRNLIVDLTSQPASIAANGLHWPVGQATSVTNMVFKMSQAPGTQHVGIFIEEGSGGFLGDLVFYGGNYGLNVGNQQFTSRNFTFYNCKTAIYQIWDWGWTYQQMSFNNVSVGLDMTSGGTENQNVASVVMLDSEFNDVDVAIVHSRGPRANPPSAGAIALENINLNNVRVAVQGPSGTNLAGSTGASNIAAWAQGHSYTQSSSVFADIQGAIEPNQRPASLVRDKKYYTSSKPQYEYLPATVFLSVRSAGAKGDAKTDDTAALQKAFLDAASTNKVVYIDGGDYLVTSTIYIPPGSRIVGEPYPVILATGPYFQDVSKPVPVLQVGRPGESGLVEMSDIIVSTKGPAGGAIMVQWNLASGNNAIQPSPTTTSTVSATTRSLTTSTTLSPSVLTSTSTTVSSMTTRISSMTRPGSDSTSMSATTSRPTNAASPSSTKPISDSSISEASASSQTSMSSMRPLPRPTSLPWSNSAAVQSASTGALPTTQSSPFHWGAWSGQSNSSPSKRSTDTSNHQLHTRAVMPVSGMWDVHTRIGGFTGSDLGIAECPSSATQRNTVTQSTVGKKCIAAATSMHITASADSVYLENCWLWVADHDADDARLRQITVYAGRGLLVESVGPVWLVGTSVEHHTLYQYQFANSRNVYMGHIQTETAYYQPNPPASIPFPALSVYNDPVFPSSCLSSTQLVGVDTKLQPNSLNNTCDGWALRMVNSENMFVYGAGLYSFFYNYNVTCAQPGYGNCQSQISSLENSNNINIYGLNTVGTQYMVTDNGFNLVRSSDNNAGFATAVTLFRTD